MSQGNESGSSRDQVVQDIVASSETGARHPAGWVGKFILLVALLWSLFQLWIASPLPFMVGNILPPLNDTEVNFDFRA